MRPRLLPPAVLAALLVAGAGAGLPAPAPTPGGDAPRVADTHVHMLDYKFDDAYQLVLPGETVTWHSHGEEAHSTTSNDSLWDSDVLFRDETYSHTFVSKGIYPYHCTAHPDLMWGEVKVGANRAPTVTLDTPGEGATLSGYATFAGSATDPDPEDAIRITQLRVDGGPWMAANSGTSWTFALDTYNYTNGPHLVEVRTSDYWSWSEHVPVNVVIENAPWVDLATSDGEVQVKGRGAVTVMARVRNVGPADSPPFHVAFSYAYKGRLHPIGEASVDGLASGASAFVSAQWLPLAKLGSFPVVARLDPHRATGDPHRYNDEGRVLVHLGYEGPPIDLLDPEIPPRLPPSPVPLPVPVPAIPQPPAT